MGSSGFAAQNVLDRSSNNALQWFNCAASILSISVFEVVPNIFLMMVAFNC
jgi:hypothetical protein